MIFKMRLKQGVYLLLSLGVSVGMFVWLFGEMAWGDVWGLIGRVRVEGVLLFLLWSFAMSVCRTWRYAVVLDLSGYRPGRVALFLTTLVRNFFSDLLPARVGTLVYVYITTSRLGVPFGAAASSFALAFLFDFLALVPLVLFAGLGLGVGGVLPVWAWVLFAGLLLVGSGLVLSFLPWGGRFVAGLLEGAGWRFLQKLAGMFRDAAAEVERAKEGGVYVRLALLSVLVRVGKYGSMYWLLAGMLIPQGVALEELEPARVFIGLLAPEVAQSLPVSGVGGFGAYEFAWSYTFELLGFPAALAKESSLAHHLFTQVYGWGLGLLALLVLLFPVFKRSEQEALRVEQASAFRFYGLVLGFVVAWAGCTFVLARLL